MDDDAMQSARTDAPASPRIQFSPFKNRCRQQTPDKLGTPTHILYHLISMV